MSQMVRKSTRYAVVKIPNLSVCEFESEHKFPFSLVSEFKHGHNREITKVGDVSELMDKAIGRLVFRVKGSVSANNYIEFDSLSLVGPMLYIQMCLAKPNIATIHLEVLTTINIPLRLTLSTLYNGDTPRFLGRSLRYETKRRCFFFSFFPF